MGSIKIHYGFGYKRNKEEELERVKKNTLITEEVGDIVYFGISRCNFVEGDTFSKKEGKKYALEALEDAREFYSNLSNSFCIGPDGLCGYCHKNWVHLLHEYFSDIDAECWHSHVLPNIRAGKRKK